MDMEIQWCRKIKDRSLYSLIMSLCFSFLLIWMTIQFYLAYDLEIGDSWILQLRCFKFSLVLLFRINYDFFFSYELNVRLFIEHVSIYFVITMCEGSVARAANIPMSRSLPRQGLGRHTSCVLYLVEYKHGRKIQI